MITLHTLDIPAEPAALGRWLEGQLVGLDLARTIAELRAVHGAPVKPQTLESLLGSHLDRILQEGLQSLPLPVLQSLLRNAELLLPLQELIWLEGGGYWDARRQPTDEMRELAGRGWERLQPYLDRSASADTGRTDELPPPAIPGVPHVADATAPAAQRPNSVQPPAPARQQPGPARSRGSHRRREEWWRHPLLVSTLSAAAAVVTVTFADHYLKPDSGSQSGPSVVATDSGNPVDIPPADSVVPLQPGPGPGESVATGDPADLPAETIPAAPEIAVAAADVPWGWNRPDAVDASLPAAEYLKRMAETAGDWQDRRTETPAELAHQIAEFRLGCSRLLTAEHAPLEPKDRDWLLERCRTWAKKFDQQLTAAEQLPFGATVAEVQAVRSGMDETVSKLIVALQKRSVELS